jgi:hypothetical protein
MVSENHLTAAELMYVSQKVERRLPTWQYANLSYGGKAILIESCLSYVLNYTMAVYLLQDKIHHKMDTARASFFWHGPNLKRKYRIDRWQLFAESGCLGFADTRKMNTCLLAKWIFILERGDTNMCYNLMRKRYMRGKSFFYCNYRGVHSFGEV